MEEMFDGLFSTVRDDRIVREVGGDNGVVVVQPEIGTATADGHFAARLQVCRAVPASILKEARIRRKGIFAFKSREFDRSVRS